MDYLPFAFVAFSAVSGLIFTLFLWIFVIPKLLPCSIPTPPIPSYLFGHAALRSSEVHNLLYTYLKWIREYGEVYRMFLFHKTLIVTSNPEDVWQVVHHRHIFKRSHRFLGVFEEAMPGFLMAQPLEEHARIRKVLRESFSAHMLDDFHKQTLVALDDLVARMDSLVQERKPFDFTREIADTSTMLLTNVAFSASFDRRTRREIIDNVEAFMREVIKAIFSYPIRHVLSILGLRKEFLHRGRILRACAEAILQRRLQENEKQKRERNSDLLDSIISFPGSTRETQVSNVALFTMAGSDTTAAAIAWTLYELCRHPEVRTRVVEEIEQVYATTGLRKAADVSKLEYTAMVWKEVLRVHPPNAVFFRVATQDTLLKGSGMFSRKGTTVNAFTMGAHRNPQYWNEPVDEFNPSRFDPVSGEANKVPRGAFIPFGVGVTVCPGQFFAEYEAIMVLSTLCRFYNFELACSPDKVCGRFDLALHPRAPDPTTAKDNLGDYSWGLPVRVSRRQSD